MWSIIPWLMQPVCNVKKKNISDVMLSIKIYIHELNCLKVVSNKCCFHPSKILLKNILLKVYHISYVFPKNHKIHVNTLW